MKKLICFDLDGTLTQHRSKLEEENKTLRNELHNLYGYGVEQAKKDLLEENEKLKQAIDILKDKIIIKHYTENGAYNDMSDYGEDYYLLHIHNITQDEYQELTQEEYKLLKEVLRNDTNKSEK